MIQVERTEREAPADAIDALLAQLDSQRGAWLGCDVEAEGLYRRASMGCVSPALTFELVGRELRVMAHSRTGLGLLERLRPLASFASTPGRLKVRFDAAGSQAHPAINVLRRFLALFSEPSPELGLYGAFSFDYYRLETGALLPDDDRRRMVLYFPERVLVSDAGRLRWVEFAFPGLGEQAGHVSPDEGAVRLEREADDLPPGGHAENVRRGVQRLQRGEVFSLVLSQTFRRRVTARPSEAFRTLRRLNPYPAMFFLNLGGGERLLGASPDLQVRADREWVESAPVCGTFRRGADPIEDADLARELLDSDKEEASLAVCADSDRNDKAKVCVPGSIELVSSRRVHFFSTIIHTIDHTRGRRKEGVDAFDVLLAHSTPATVTGTPKAAAISAIEELESEWRGWYAGAVGRFAAEGSTEVLTVLRAARVVGSLAEVRTGGNLLVDSIPLKEEEETRLKAEAMFRVLGGVSPRPPSGVPGFDRRFHVRLVGPQDSLLASLGECLESVGCTLEAGGDPHAEGGLMVVSGAFSFPPEEGPGRDSPLLAIGEAALTLMQGDGCVVEMLELPRYARRAHAAAQAATFAAGLGALEVGLYANQIVKTGSVSNDWRPALVSSEGWVLAAEHQRLRRIAILCRPDSIQSMKGFAGRRLLRAALEALSGSR